MADEKQGRQAQRRPAGQRGRPRSFDRAGALDRATEVFWAQGYTATSVNDLTSAMEITPPSLYSAFGSKRELFREVVAHYQATAGARVAAPLKEEGTARETIEAVLRLAAQAYPGGEHPPGCLVISADANCGPDAADVQEELRAHRAATTASIVERITADQAAGLLPAGLDANGLAKFYAGVIQGMSQQARDGATREELLQLAAYAMAAWPSE